MNIDEARARYNVQHRPRRHATSDELFEEFVLCLTLRRSLHWWQRCTPYARRLEVRMNTVLTEIALRAYHERIQQ